MHEHLHMTTKENCDTLHPPGRVGGTLMNAHTCINHRMHTFLRPDNVVFGDASTIKERTNSSVIHGLFRWEITEEDRCLYSVSLEHSQPVVCTSPVTLHLSFLVRWLSRISCPTSPSAGGTHSSWTCCCATDWASGSAWSSVANWRCTTTTGRASSELWHP